MKVNQHVHDVERIGVEGEQEFKIRTTAKAFDILSSGIYSDPIMAVIRELSCNAYDAHVEAGKADTPFEIHLPSKLEPWFSVIDHGIGLNDEDARGLFTTYFESTKTDTNDQIGAFGLGSKSPFSYTKAFEVICRFEGKKRTYSIFLNEHGVPTIATLATINTDECNGVEVKIAVRSGDYNLFRDKAAQVLRYFPVKPTVKGSAGFRFEEIPDSAIKGDGYYVWKSRNWNNNIVAVQGNVPYKVDLDHLFKHMTSELREFIDDYDMVGYFDIGELDIAASREEVRYDERTVDNLVSKMEQARVDFLKNLDKEISALTKSGKKWDVFATLRDRFTYVSNVKDIAGNYKFTSKMFNEWIEQEGRVVVDSGEYHTIKYYRSGQTRAVPIQFASDYQTVGKGKNVVNVRVSLVRPDKDIQVMYNDVTKRSSIRINNWIRTTSGKDEVIAITPKSDRILANNGVAIPTDAQRKAEYNKIVATLGNPLVQELSRVTQDVTVAGAPRKSGHTFKLFRPSRYTRSDRVKPTFEEATEPKNGGIYIEITQLRDTIVNGKQYNWNNNSFTHHVECMLEVINYVKGTKYEPKEVYGLTKKVIKAVKDDANWNSISDLYKEAVDDIKDVVEVRARIRSTRDSIGVCDYLEDKHLINIIKGLDAKSEFRNIVEPAIEAAKVVEQARKKGLTQTTISNVLNLNKLVGVKMQIDDTPFFKNENFEAYKMLSTFGLPLHKSGADTVIAEYIKLVEAN